MIPRISTADLVALIRCAAKYNSVTADAALVMSLLRRVEPSDPVFVDRYALYLSRQHRVVETYDSQMSWYVAYAYGAEVTAT